MHLAFRCDAGELLGSGHLRRCAVLAEEAVSKRHRVSFLLHTDGNPAWSEYLPEGVELEVRTTHAPDLVGELAEWLAATKPDFLVVDQYELMHKRAAEIAQLGVPWMMFDHGLGEQKMWADVLHNALPGYTTADYAARYDADKSQLLLGPSYALLRPEFFETIRLLPESKSIALLFGGGHDRGMILRVLRAAASALPDWDWNIFTTSLNAGLPEIQDWIREQNLTRVHLLIDEPRVALHLAQSDLALSAGGTTLFELAFLGIPTIGLAIAENQIVSGQKWAGLIEFLGHARDISDDTIRETIVALARDPARCQAMSEKARLLVDGHGAERTIGAINRASQTLPC